MLSGKLNLVAKGFCVGVADIVPGVSGSTIAFILGIYSKLINAIKSFDSQWLAMIFTLNFKGAFQRPHFGFLIPLGIGIFFAILFFTHIVPLPLLVRTHSEIVYSLFFGLILGSILLFLYQLKAILFSKYLIFLVLGVIAGACCINLVPSSTPDDNWFIFICGVLSISAMLLPGISGSFILLMLNKYAYILNAIGHFEVTVIMPFVFGIITGLIFFSRLISCVFKDFYHQTMLFMIGLLVVSLYVIWPFQHRFYDIYNEKEILISSLPYIPELVNQELSYSIAMIVFGLLIVIILSRISKESVTI